MATTDTRTVRYGEVDLEYARRLASTPPEEDAPVWMVNLMKYREVADYAEGGAAAGRTGRQADDLYAPLESLAGVGAEVVFFGDVDTQLLGDSTTWDRVAVVKYPTRRSFIDMQTRQDFQEKVGHKDAGMEKSIIIGCRPLAAPVIPDPPDWATVPHPPTEADGPVMVLHVLRFVDLDGGLDHMTSYQTAAGTVARPHGVRVDGWFTVDGTIVGDGRAWHQVRFNAFPSRAAFMAVVMDPERLAVQHEHRETAIADTYTMIIRPKINKLAESIAG